MNTANIVGLVIYFIAATIMIVIGVLQMKSQKPVGFYSGEKAPCEDEVSDVRIWNKKHGIMWMVYGIVLMISYVAGVLIDDSIWSMILIFGGVLVPLIVMVWYHRKLVRVYRK